MPFDPGASRRWLGDIRHHIVLAQTFAAGMRYDALRDDLCVTYAVTRCLEIISEVSRRLPDGRIAESAPAAFAARIPKGGAPRCNGSARDGMCGLHVPARCITAPSRATAARKF